jgi:hypothetical protein
MAMATNPRRVDAFWIPERFPWGRPAPFWIRFREIVGKTIREYKLEPVDPQYGRGLVLSVREEPLPEIHWPGGLRTPHLHFKGELYELTPEQWDEFSGQVMADFREKLTRAGTVTFDKLLELSDAIDSIG